MTEEKDIYIEQCADGSSHIYDNESDARNDASVESKTKKGCRVFKVKGEKVGEYVAEEQNK